MQVYSIGLEKELIVWEVLSEVQLLMSSPVSIWRQSVVQADLVSCLSPVRNTHNLSWTQPIAIEQVRDHLASWFLCLSIRTVLWRRLIQRYTAWELSELPTGKLDTANNAGLPASFSKQFYLHIIRGMMDIERPSQDICLCTGVRLEIVTPQTPVWDSNSQVQDSNRCRIT